MLRYAPEFDEPEFERVRKFFPAEGNAPFMLLRWKPPCIVYRQQTRMPKTPLTHHLVALWFADIAGYSDRAAEDEHSALQLIEILQSLSRDTVRRYEG